MSRRSGVQLRRWCARRRDRGGNRSRFPPRRLETGEARHQHERRRCTMPVRIASAGLRSSRRCPSTRMSPSSGARQRGHRCRQRGWTCLRRSYKECSCGGNRQRDAVIGEYGAIALAQAPHLQTWHHAVRRRQLRLFRLHFAEVEFHLLGAALDGGVELFHHLLDVGRKARATWSSDKAGWRSCPPTSRRWWTNSSAAIKSGSKKVELNLNEVKSE